MHISLDVLERWHHVGAEGVGAVGDAGEHQASKTAAEARQELVQAFLRQVVAQVQVQARQPLQVAPLRPGL